MNNRELTISDLISVALKRLWIIAAALVAGALLALYYSCFMVTPVYKSVSKYLVDTTTLSGDTLNQSSSTQIEVQRITALSRLVVSSYIEILDTQNFAEYIADKLESENIPLSKSYSGKNISSMIEFSFEEESESFTVAVTALSAEDALAVAECIQREAGKYLASKKTSAAETLKIIDDARINYNPVNVRTTLTVLIGAFIGAVLAFAVCFLVEINDVRVKDEKEVSEILGLPVIGSIPEYVVSADSRKQENSK